MAIRFFAALFTTVLVLASTLAVAGDPPHEETGLVDDAVLTLLEPTVARIHEIKAPLLTLPAFTKAGSAFAAELAVADDVGVTARLSDADAGVTCGLSVLGGARDASRAWGDLPALSVRHFTLTVDAACPPGLYDFVVDLADPLDPLGLAEDAQPNAVRVMDPARFDALASGNAEPRFVVLADPQVGDPRAYQDGFTASLAEQSPGPFFTAADGTLGDLSDGEDGRWKAIRHAFAEARKLDPDFVLIAGDLGFGQAVPGSYAVEYEEIYRVIAAAGVPVFASMGNHDGYVANGQDGYAYWRAYLGPTYYFTQMVPGTTLLAMNTYDWSEMDRIGASLAVSSWGGQIRAEQMAWMRASLAALRASDADERVIALSHHSPSWRQDPYFEADPTGATGHVDGVPVAEQVTRGVVTFGVTDQAWSGEGRLELRDLLREYDVEIAFAGHTHRDRVARDDGDGRIVETHQSSYAMPEDYDPRELHYFERDDSLIFGYTQAELADMIREAAGPLYVETTTVMSGTSQYWGYRHVEIAYTEKGHLDLPRFGYPITEAELEELVHDPSIFNHEHASLGLFSTPLDLQPGLPWSIAAEG